MRGEVGRNRPDRRDWFGDNFWGRHDNLRPSYYGNYPQGHWWGWATAVGVGSWLGWNRDPAYYGYYDDSYYWGSSDGSYGTTVDYSEQAEEIEAAADQPASDEWMSLGVFALSKSEGTAVTPNIYMQLALNKDGLISGTYYNDTNDGAYEVEGLVDKATQRAAWKVVDSDNAPILETGIYNLTQDETPVQAHFTDGRTQEMLLVRLPEE